MVRKKPRHYVCLNCGAVNNFTLTNHRIEQPIYTGSAYDRPTHYYFGGRYTTIECNVCNNGIFEGLDEEDVPEIKPHGVYKYD